MSYDREIDSSREAVPVGRPGPSRSRLTPLDRLQINEKGALQYPGGGKTESDWKEAAPAPYYLLLADVFSHTHNAQQNFGCCMVCVCWHASKIDADEFGNHENRGGNFRKWEEFSFRVRQ